MGPGFWQEICNRLQIRTNPPFMILLTLHHVTICKVNEFQGCIRDTTRRMMATVSELSMHQATALKLQQEKMARERDLQEAT